jgi:hypothetical protein
MAPASATTRIILVAYFFFLPLSFSHYVAAVSPPLSFSFNFSNTSSYRREDLQFQGDVAISDEDKLVDLITCKPFITSNCSGRMSYNYPVPLYDSITGEVASFATTFTFTIELAPNTTTKGDGMTFFLAGYPSRVPPDSVGPLLGLTNNSQATASGQDRFLAVEFDTYDNTWDPVGANDHIGIDLNSIASVVTKTLPSHSLNGTMTATITFDNTTKTLEATLYFANRSLATASIKTTFSGRMDALLPPEVAVGFSATTGGYFEYNRIHSWSFNSTMPARGTDFSIFQSNRSTIITIIRKKYYNN